MKAKIALATVSGKAYYLIVNELKRRDVPFVSLTPYDHVPIDIKVVITTEKERPLISHNNIITFREGTDPQALVNQALRQIEGKNSYNKIVIGVDPGEILGLAVLADGKIIKTENCFSINETIAEIENIVKNLEDSETLKITVKVGDGVPEYKEKLLNALDERLSSNIEFESVSEAGTDRYISEAKHRRGLRDIVSAIKIARRNGQKFVRKIS
ncbi:MAG: hypothetical protein QW717_01190 [Candidatus Bathyarchaeia archaeon]